VRARNFTVFTLDVVLKPVIALIKKNFFANHTYLYIYNNNSVYLCEPPYMYIGIRIYARVYRRDTY
jgi:sulfur relay (sulfurtransferase) DsrF/TusC family protein